MDPDPPAATGAGDASAAEMAERAAADAWLTSLHAIQPKPRLGQAAALANVAVFLAMVAAGVDWRNPSVRDLIAWGANDSRRTLHGEPWRLLTAAFLHAGVIHLAFNVWGLWQFRWIERILGRSGFLVVYLVSAIAASLTSLTGRGLILSVGASGALCGIVGALLSAALFHRRSGLPRLVRTSILGSLLLLLGINAVLGAMMPAIDNRAHVGGLLAGFVVAVAMVRPPTPEAVAGRARRAVLTAAASAVVLAVVFAVEHRAAGSDPWSATEEIEETRERASAILARIEAGQFDEADRLWLGEEAFRRIAVARERSEAAEEVQAAPEYAKAVREFADSATRLVERVRDAWDRGVEAERLRARAGPAMGPGGG